MVKSCEIPCVYKHMHKPTHTGTCKLQGKKKGILEDCL